MKPGIYWSDVTENYVVYGWSTYWGGEFYPKRNPDSFIVGGHWRDDEIDICKHALVFKALQLEWVCEF